MPIKGPGLHIFYPGFKYCLASDAHDYHFITFVLFSSFFEKQLLQILAFLLYLLLPEAFTQLKVTRVCLWLGPGNPLGDLKMLTHNPWSVGEGTPLDALAS